VYYIQHEILSEKEENIVDFMAGSVPEGVTRETVVNTLKEVGFDDAKMAATIQVRSVQKFFTHRPVSTFDRVPFQLTSE
jgi:hypothetical protein